MISRESGLLIEQGSLPRASCGYRVFDCWLDFGVARRSIVAALIIISCVVVGLASVAYAQSNDAAAGVNVFDLAPIGNDVTVRALGDGLLIETDKGKWSYAATLAPELWPAVEGPVRLRVDLVVEIGDVGVGVLKQGSWSEFIAEEIVAASRVDRKIDLTFGSVSEMGPLIIGNGPHSGPMRIILKSVRLESKRYSASQEPAQAGDLNVQKITNATSPLARKIASESELNASLISPLQFMLWNEVKRMNRQGGTSLANNTSHETAGRMSFATRSATKRTMPSHFYFGGHWGAGAQDNDRIAAVAEERAGVLARLHTELNSPAARRSKEILTGILADLQSVDIERSRISMDLPDGGDDVEIRTVELSTRDVRFGETQYSIRYFLWEAVPGRFLPAVLYMPVHRSLEPPVPLVISPLGCGENLDTNIEITSVQKRLANFALRGMAAFSTLGLCQNGYFNSKIEPRNAYTFETYAQIAGVNESESTLMAEIWLRAIEFLGRQAGIDDERIGATGYSNGASNTLLISHVSDKVSAFALVAALINRSNDDSELMSRFNPLKDWYFVLGRDDQLTSTNETILVTDRLGKALEPYGLNSPKLSIVDGAHNFDAERRILVADWLAQVLGARPLIEDTRGIEFDTPLFDLDIPERAKTYLEGFNLHDHFSEIARHAKQARFPRDFSNWAPARQRDWLGKLIGLDDQIGESAHGSILIDQQSIGSGSVSLNYEAWVVPIDRELQSLVAVVNGSEVPASPSVELVISTSAYMLPDDVIDRAVGNQSVAAILVLPGYGPLADSQMTTGNLARNQIKSFTLLGMASEAISNAVTLLKSRFPNASVAVSTEGVEAGIAGAFAFALDERIVSMTQHNAISSFDRLLDDEDLPVPPPIMLVPGIFAAIDIPQLAGMGAPRPFVIDSESDLTEFPALQ